MTLGTKADMWQVSIRSHLGRFELASNAANARNAPQIPTVATWVHPRRRVRPVFPSRLQLHLRSCTAFSVWPLWENRRPPLAIRICRQKGRGRSADGLKRRGKEDYFSVLDTLRGEVKVSQGLKGYGIITVDDLDYLPT